MEEDLTYARCSLGVEEDREQGTHKALGIQWNVTHDNILFDVTVVTDAMDNPEPTKRSIISATAKFFDPLGVISPVTILFKVFAQQLCESRVGWDEPLTFDPLKQWNYLLAMMDVLRLLWFHVSSTLDLPNWPNWLDFVTLHPRRMLLWCTCYWSPKHVKWGSSWLLLRLRSPQSEVSLFPAWSSCQHFTYYWFSDRACLQPQLLTVHSDFIWCSKQKFGKELEKENNNSRLLRLLLLS